MFESIANLTMKWMQDLLDVLMKLRDEYNYCLFCGCKVSEHVILLKSFNIFSKDETANIRNKLTFFPSYFSSMNQVLSSWITALESMKMTTEFRSLKYNRLYLVCSFCQAITDSSK